MSQQLPAAAGQLPPQRSYGWARTLLLLIVGLVILGIVFGGAYGVWTLFLKGSGPAAIGSAPPVVPSGAAVGSLASTDGTWTVDPTIGSFSDFSDSWVGYIVEEKLAGIGANSAKGRTPDVTGSLTLAGPKLTAAALTADLTTLRSDDSMRDGQLGRQGIQTNQFPTATFTLTAPVDLGAIPADGGSVSVTATGDLTLHGVTKSVQVPIKATLNGDVIGVNGSIPIAFADFGVTPPNSFKVLSIDDNGVMEFQVFFRHG